MNFIAKLKDLLSNSTLKISHFLWPICFGLLATAFEIISIMLLIPVVNSLIKMDTSYIEDLPLVGSYVFQYFDFNKNSIAIYSVILSIIFIMIILKASSVYVGGVSTTYLVQKLGDDLRRNIFNRYLSYGKVFFDRHSSGHLYQVLMGYTQALSSNMSQVQRLSTAILMLLGYALVLFYLNFKITLFAICLFPILHYSMSFLVKKIKRTSKHHALIQNKLGKKMSNALSSIELVKAYCNEHEEKEEFSRMSEGAFLCQYSISKKMELIAPLQEIIIFIASMLLLLLMVLQLKEYPPGAIGKFIVYFFVLKRASNVFGAINEMRAVISSMQGPWTEITKVFTSDKNYFVEEGDKEFPLLRECIEFKKLDFSYDKKTPVLNNVSFKFQKGKMTALVGTTGSGKSTIANLIMRFYDCPKDSLFLDGVEVHKYSIASIRSKIAIVSQDAILFNGTIRENILYGLNRNVSEEELINAVKQAELYDYIMSTELKFETLVGDLGVQLSGGEKQRVSIARAMLKKAEIFILDEATSALDSNTENKIQNAIQRMITDKTAIVIAHRLSTVKSADQVIVLEGGRIVESGVPAELLRKKGIFSRYLDEQSFN